MARTPRVVDDRRVQIIESAMRVFAKKGFAAATNRDVADEAAITPGLIYHYFKSKEDLLRTVLEEYPARQSLRSISSQTIDQSPEDLLRSLAHQILSTAEDENVVRILRVFLPAVIHQPELSASGSSTIQALVRFVEKALMEKMERGDLCRANAGLVAQLFVGSLLDLVLRRQVIREPSLLRYTQDEIVESLVNLTLQGLLPRTS